MFRRDRVSEEIKHQVSIILQRDIRDSRIGLVTITKVDMSPDLKSADIFFTSIREEGGSEDVLRALRVSAGLIRRLLSKQIRIKFLPRINFIYDDSGKTGNRIDEIIDIIHKDKETPDGD